MRWSPLAVALPFLFFTTSTTAYPVSATTEDTTPSRTFAKRAAPTECQKAGFNSDTLRTVNANACKKTGAAFNWVDAAKLSKIGSKLQPTFSAADVGINIQTSAKVVSTTITSNAGFICDHILELSILKFAMDGPGGICDQLTTKFPNIAARKAAIQPIIAAVNSANNLVFFKEEAETQKGQYTQDFIAKNTAKLAKPLKPFALLAVADYLVKTNAKSIQVAKDLDKLITAQFGQAQAKVETTWRAYLAQVNKQEAASLASLKKLQAAAGSSTKTASTKTTAVKKPPAQTPAVKKPSAKKPAAKKPAVKKPPTS